jgi:hypothetical protein
MLIDINIDKQAASARLRGAVNDRGS